MSNVGRTYKTADAAFKNLYDRIHFKGFDFDHGKGNTGMRLFNEGFYILRPWENEIRAKFRNWNPQYAKREWDWYISKNRSVEELKKYAPIWDKMHGGDNIVNSNYGYQWNRNDQLVKTLKLLSDKPGTRQAWMTIYDGKESDDYEYDTPCTLNVGFNIIDDTLNMNVLMRSNDLWYGFCNDQYCFSNLQMQMAKLLKKKVGWYFHYANDLHIYTPQLNAY